MKTFASLFGGFGGVDTGARAAGLELAWSVELDPRIAEVANANLGEHTRVANILECDPFDFERVDVLHASPPCTNASVANSGARETELDIALGRKTAEVVTVLRPRIFTLENVWAYRHFKAWHFIEDALWQAGYWLSVEYCNAADYGVPQSRKRMIVRAVRGGFVPYLPDPLPWVGWYAAIEDLLDTLPESRFAKWQLARLPELLRTVLVPQGGDRNYDLPVQPVESPSFTITANHNMLGVRAFLMADGGNTNLNEAHPGKGCRYADEPSHTVPAISSDGGAMPKAWLVDGANASPTGQLTIRGHGEPAHTITNGGRKHPIRSLLHWGRVVAMTPRALARFQSFPDNFELPDNARLSAKGIGNAMPPLMYQHIIEPLLEVTP